MSETVSAVAANGLEFRYLSAGDGPLALLLHGFPDSAQTWRHLLPALAEAGFRAVAPWTRGYAPTAVPADGDYRVSTLAADANALHDALGGGPDAVLVGHDWGAITAYGAAALEPDRWRRVVTMAVPPPAVASAAFFDYAQLKKSFYVYLFQTDLAELVAGGDDLAFIDNLWRDWSPSYDGGVDLAHVKDALREPDNLRAAIGYYRAMFGGGVLGDSPPHPTLYLHGEDDGAFLADRVPDSKAHLSAESEVRVVPGVGHFLHLERPDEINRQVVDWLTTG
ncbi:MAG TPA: alpha/beta hydrolase [Mycobacteriales bacterium]|nr:alpha/beta hydrolase [Mycobacteriales bacterium]